MQKFLTVVIVGTILVGGFFGARQLVNDLTEEYWQDGTGIGGGEVVVCTMDALLCPDGSAVGRTGPNCEFAPCPLPSEPMPEATPSPTPGRDPMPMPPESSPLNESMSCDPANRPEMCTKEYRPVCGLVQVECITTPCNPIPETFGNACDACSNERVVSYTEGACSLEE